MRNTSVGTHAGTHFRELFECGELQRDTLRSIAYEFAARERKRKANDAHYQMGSEHALSTSVKLRQAAADVEADHEAHAAAYQEQTQRAQDVLRELRRDEEHRRLRFKGEPTTSQ